MSSEPEQPTDTTTAADSDDPPVEPTPVPTEPDPVEPTTPEAPPAPTDPIVVDPATWYQVESVCTTATCPNLNHATTEPEVYSNGGGVQGFGLVCGVCGKRRQVLAAVKLDPQPEMS